MSESNTIVLADAIARRARGLCVRFRRLTSEQKEAGESPNYYHSKAGRVLVYGDGAIGIGDAVLSIEDVRELAQVLQTAAYVGGRRQAQLRGDHKFVPFDRNGQRFVKKAGKEYPVRRMRPRLPKQCTSCHVYSKDPGWFHRSGELWMRKVEFFLCESCAEPRLSAVVGIGSSPVVEDS